MVAVAHEVHIADLVHIDRRQVAQLVERDIQPFPALGIRAAQRQEGAVEIPVAAHAPDDVGDGDRLPAAIDPVAVAQEILHLFERQQRFVRLLTEKTQQPGD